LSHELTLTLVWVVGITLVALTAGLLLELLLVSVAAILPGRKPNQLEPNLPAIQRLTVIVPSHNEEGSIVRCIESIAASAGGTKNILVIAHNCDDNTQQFALSAGANVFVLDDPNLPGKGYALSKGFDLAFREYGADAAMIIDADSTISLDLIPKVRESLSRASVVQCRYETTSIGMPLRARLRALAFRCMNIIRPRGRKRLGLSCGIFGNGFALRAEVLGRVRYTAVSIVEDLEFHLSLLNAGIRTEFIEDAVVSAEVPQTSTGERTQSARWEGGRLRILISRGPSLFGQFLSGRPSLIEPIIDLMGAPIGIGVCFLCILLLLPVTILRLYAVCGLAIVTLHVLVGVYQGPDPKADLIALASSPFYVLSKVAMLPAIFRAGGRRANWVRTSRATAPQQERSDKR
jgi:cellulose synthase/poly-beta-1,6-N-acetylglucosamine synthase-like glycosyltransferase